MSYVCSKLRKSPYIYIAAAMFGRQKNAYRPTFPYNMIETSPTSLAQKSVVLTFFQLTSNVVKGHAVWSCSPCQNLGKLIIICIFMLSNNTICKPPILLLSHLLTLTICKTKPGELAAQVHQQCYWWEIPLSFVPKPNFLQLTI